MTIRGSVVLVDLRGVSVADCVASASSLLTGGSAYGGDCCLGNVVQAIGNQFNIVSGSCRHEDNVCPFVVGVLLPSSPVTPGQKRPREHTDLQQGNTNVVRWLYNFTDRVDSIITTEKQGFEVTPSHWSRGSNWEAVRSRILSQLVEVVSAQHAASQVEDEERTVNDPLSGIVKALLSCVAVASKCFNCIPLPHHNSNVVSNAQLDDEDDEDVSSLADAEQQSKNPTDRPALLTLISSVSLRASNESQAQIVEPDPSQNQDKVAIALSQVARLLLNLNVRLIFGEEDGGSITCRESPMRTRLRSLALLTRGFWGPLSPSSTAEETTLLSVIELMAILGNGVAEKDGKSGSALRRFLLTGSAVTGGPLLSSILAAFPLHPPQCFFADDLGTSYIDTRTMALISPEAVAEAAAATNSSLFIKTEGGVTIQKQRTAPLATQRRAGGSSSTGPKIERTNATVKPEA